MFFSNTCHNQLNCYNCLHLTDMIRGLGKNYKNLFYASVSRHLVDNMKYLHLPNENIYKSLIQGQGCNIHLFVSLFVCLKC